MDRPKVGVATIVLKDEKVLLGKRKGAHGEGSYGLPGGHLEFMESFEAGAVREVTEETGIKIKNVRFGVVTNDLFKEENKHYITIFMIADYDSGEPQILEPDRVECWEWHAWEELPRPLFLPIENLLETDFHPLKD